MNEDIEYAMAHILDWKKIYEKYALLKGLEMEIKRRWTRAIHEDAMCREWPHVLDKNKLEIGLFHVVNKYKPMNSKSLYRVMREKEKPPIEIKLAAVNTKKTTSRGSMYYCISKNEIFVLTGHAVRRMVERGNLEEQKDLPALAAIYSTFSKMVIDG